MRSQSSFYFGLLMLLLVPLKGKTQSEEFVPLVTLNYTFSQYNTEGFNLFHDSFNNFWGDELSKGWDQVNGREFSQPGIGIGFRYRGLKKVAYTAESMFVYGKRSLKNNTLWTSGVEQRYRFQARDLYWTFSQGIVLFKRFFVELYTGGVFRRLRLHFTTVHTDGSESYSTEYKLNGFYSGTTTALEWGGQLGYKWKNFMFYGRFTNVIPNFPPAKGIVNLDDYDSNNFVPTEFPSNYVTYATDPIAFVQNNDGLRTDDFEGMKLILGINFDLKFRNQ